MKKQVFYDGKTYPSIRAAAKALNTSRGSVMRALKKGVYRGLIIGSKPKQGKDA